MRREFLKALSGMATAGTIPAVRSVETLQPKADEVCVLTFKERLRPEDIERIRQAWTAAWQGARPQRVIVLDAGATLSVMKEPKG